MKTILLNTKILLLVSVVSFFSISCEKETNNTPEETATTENVAKVPEIIYSNVTIQGNNGKFISSENGQAPMTCNRTVADTWETFQLVRTTVNGYKIRGNNGKYVRVDESTGSNVSPDVAPLYCDADRKDAMTFWISRYPRPSGKYFISKYKVARYLTSENGERPMNLNRTEIDTWEEFTITNFDPHNN